MQLWITAEECEDRSPGWLDQAKDAAWRTADGKPFIGRIDSRFGFAEVRVQLNPDGTPAFARLCCGEAPNINAVVWGKTESGEIRIGVTVQKRPLADSFEYSVPALEPFVFGQPYVGAFSEKLLLGEEAAETYESAKDASIREAFEEAGVVDIINVTEMSFHNPNPTFVVTWSALFDVEVNLGTVTGQTDRSEGIYRCEYIPIGEVFSRIAQGEHEGISYRQATANDAFLVWLARHPEALAQAVS